MKLFIAISIENPRVGGSISPPGHHFQKQYQWQKWQFFRYQTYDGFVAYSDSTVDKLNFVIFVITPILLEPKIDKATRLRLPTLFKPAFF